MAMLLRLVNLGGRCSVSAIRRKSASALVVSHSGSSSSWRYALQTCIEAPPTAPLSTSANTGRRFLTCQNSFRVDMKRSIHPFKPICNWPEPNRMSKASSHILSASPRLFVASDSSQSACWRFSCCPRAQASYALTWSSISPGHLFRIRRVGVD